MLRGRHTSSAAPARSVNLYCAHCEVQIGIFENEWVRLTSSYARSKDKGTQFGTQIGERLQTVPPGAVNKSAVGCQMAEVFCRKCSNMVGQYCKSAPSGAQQDLVHQLFYKLSRTFLKDSRTNERVDPVFAFNANEEGPVSVVRHNSIPARWQNTPLRESSSTPMSVQAAARNRTHRQQSDLEGSTRDDSASADNDMDDGANEANNFRSSSNSRNGPGRRQSTRVVDREGRMFELEGRLRFHDGRLMDQENFLNDVSARVHEQDSVIEEQRVSFENHESSFHQMREQMVSLQRSMADLQSDLLHTRVEDVLQQPLLSGGIDLAEKLESLAQAFRSAHDATQEVESLKAENQQLRNRLSKVTTEDTFNTDDPQPDAAQSANSLGKRKRDGHNAEPMLTPLSNRSTQPSPNQVADHAHAEPVSQAAEQGMQAEKGILDPGKRGDKIKVQKRGRQSTASNAQSVLQPHQSEAEAAVDTSAHLESMDITHEDDSLLPIDNEPITDQDQQMQFVQDPSAFDDLGFSDEEDEENDNSNFDIGQNVSENSTHAVDNLNTAGLRDGRSTAPEPFLKPKAPANRTRTYITLDRAHIATPWTFWEAISNGQQPKLIKPPAIQTRKKDLEDELTALGLQHWIGKDKKSKAYREAVDAARTRLRNEKRDLLLASRGLKPGATSTVADVEEISQPAVLSAIQNVRATDRTVVAEVEIVSGDENSQSTSTSQRKGSEADATEGHNEPPTSLRVTRRRGQQASIDLGTPDSVTETARAAEDGNEGDQPSKRKRKPTERAKSQRKSETGTSQPQEGMQKRGRGRPRKSAPASLAAPSVELQVESSNQDASHDATDKELTVMPNGARAAEGASPTLSASKQQLLEKMRLKAQQKDQLREEMIKARDRLAEEAMAAMDMEEIAA